MKIETVAAGVATSGGAVGYLAKQGLTPADFGLLLIVSFIALVFGVMAWLGIMAHEKPADARRNRILAAWILGAQWIMAMGLSWAASANLMTVAMISMAVGAGGPPAFRSIIKSYSDKFKGGE